MCRTATIALDYKAEGNMARLVKHRCPEHDCELVEMVFGVEKLLDSLKPYVQFTAFRCGELCGLRVEDLKLEHGVIEVRRAVWNGIEGETKTMAGKRNVFIDSATIRLLRDFLAGRQSSRLFQSRASTPLEN